MKQVHELFLTLPLALPAALLTTRTPAEPDLLRLPAAAICEVCS